MASSQRQKADEMPIWVPSEEADSRKRWRVRHGPLLVVEGASEPSLGWGAGRVLRRHKLPQCVARRGRGTRQPSPQAPQSLFHGRGFAESDPGKEKRVLPRICLHFRDPGMVILAKQGLLGAVDGRGCV